MSIRSAVTCWTCQRALSGVHALAASRKRASFGLRSVGAWMRIAATASFGAGRGSGIPADDRSAVGSAAVMVENVVLIDEADAALGVGEKLSVHRRGALHRA